MHNPLLGGEIILYMILSAIWLPLGALFRRYWGGWTTPNHTLKRTFGFTLALCMAGTTIFAFNAHGIGATIIATICICGILWFVKGHGWAHGMGTVDGKPLWLCVIVFWLNYWGAMAIAGLSWYFLTNDPAGLWYAAFGCLTPIPHILAQYPKGRGLWEFFGLKDGDVTKGLFIDGRTCLGEMGLGAILFSMPLAKLLTLILL